MSKKTPLSKEEEGVASILLYMRKKIVPIIGKKDTSVLVVLFLSNGLSPLNEKGLLFVERVLSKIRGKVDEEFVQFLRQYFKIH